MPHNIIKKVINRIPAIQYGRKQEERQSETKPGRELLNQTRTVRGRVRTFKRFLKKKFQKYDE